MRRWYLVGLVMLSGCTEDLSPEEEYVELQARTTLECGTYRYNYPPDEPAPMQLCGEQPNIACLDDALAGNQVAHLIRSYYEAKYIFEETPTLLAREHHYFATDGKIVWIAYYEIGFDDPGWYRRDCSSIAVEPIELGDTTCWHWRANDCVWR